MIETSPLVRLSDLVAHDGAVTRVVGTYQAIDTRPYPNVRREPDGKVTRTFMIARLELEDGTLVRLGIRPQQELDALDDKRVVAVGRVEASPQMAPGMAQELPYPRLHDVQSVTLLLDE